MSIPEHQGYEITEEGNVWTNFYQKWLKLTIEKFGYVRVSLQVNGRSKKMSVHRLVAKTFIPNPDNLPQVNHMDGDKQNNHVSNLEWCSGEHNIRHAYKLGLIPNNSGTKNNQSLLNDEQVLYIREVYKFRSKDFSGEALGKQFNVSPGTIRDIVARRRWRHI